MTMSALGRAFALVLVTIVVAACRKSAPPAPPPTSQPPPALEVSADGKWLYTYADDAGNFVTTDDAKKIPAGSRRVVRVLDPAKAADARADLTAVYVVDLDELERKGKVVARVASREAFETGALSQLPPGEFSPYPGPAAGPPGAGAAAAGDEAPSPLPEGPVPVTLYGTSWCGACKSARAYLRQRKIPFADRDIERDAAAARELKQKASRLGVSADRIPVLEVRGRLLIGFDRARLERLLGEAT